MIPALIVLAALIASTLVYRSQRGALDSNWKQLAPAVPDDKAIEGAPYREQAESQALVPHSRKALELLPGTRNAKRLQIGMAIAAAPLAALLFAIWPDVLGLWGPAVGGLWGLGTGGALLKDDRRSLGALAMAMLPAMVLFPMGYGGIWPAVVGCFALYGSARLVLDQKDAASKEEADRERLADPRYLVGSREGRAAGIARNRGGGGDSTDASSRDNSTAT